jgi:hypothetical protein
MDAVQPGDDGRTAAALNSGGNLSETDFLNNC